MGLSDVRGLRASTWTEKEQSRGWPAPTRSSRVPALRRTIARTSHRTHVTHRWERKREIGRSGVPFRSGASHRARGARALRRHVRQRSSRSQWQSARRPHQRRRPLSWSRASPSCNLSRPCKQRGQRRIGTHARSAAGRATHLASLAAWLHGCAQQDQGWRVGYVGWQIFFKTLSSRNFCCSGELCVDEIHSATDESKLAPASR